MNFASIPMNVRTPGTYVEFDASNAVTGLPVASSRIVLAGQKLATGQAAAGQPVTITRLEDAFTGFGRGSMLAAMCAIALSVGLAGEIIAVPLDDAAGAVAASGKIAVAGPASSAGVVDVRIAGRRYRFAAAQAMTAAAIATQLAALVNGDVDAPVTAAAAAEEVTLTARNKGKSGNLIDIRLGRETGEALPSDVMLTVTAMAGGALDPDISTALAAVADMGFKLFVSPYADATALTTITNEFKDRQGGIRQLEGLALVAIRATFGEATALGDTVNDPYRAILPVGGSPTSPWFWATSLAATIAHHSALDPARPLQTLEIRNVIAPEPAQRFTRTERELLLNNGLSTFTVDSDGTVRIERMVTNYQTNAAGLADTAWLNLETPLTLQYLRETVRIRFTAKYPRHKLANDGTRFAPGSAVVTPSMLTAELIALARLWEEAGLVENIDRFKADLKVVRSTTDQDRVDALIPPDIVNGFRVFAAAIGFIL